MVEEALGRALPCPYGPVLARAWHPPPLLPIPLNNPDTATNTAECECLSGAVQRLGVVIRSLQVGAAQPASIWFGLRYHPQDCAPHESR